MDPWLISLILLSWSIGLMGRKVRAYRGDIRYMMHALCMNMVFGA
jgi:hypothetical protein